jgi:hypothetical protein
LHVIRRLIGRHQSQLESPGERDSYMNNNEKNEFQPIFTGGVADKRLGEFDQ